MRSRAHHAAEPGDAAVPPVEGVAELGDQRLEYRWLPPRRPGRPSLVFLHEGLGALALWRDFPARVAAASGCATLVYSRRGYGRSSPLPGPRDVDYMHREGQVVLPALLAALDIDDPLLIGHSDGASIALLYAGTPAARAARPPRGLVLMAPHLFVEDLTVASIAEAKRAYAETDLRQRLARHHADVDGAFRGWNDIWLHPDFRAWNIEAVLPQVTCPILAIQGLDDQYGTLAQLDALERGATGPVARLELPDCRHSPQRDQAAATEAAILDFISEVTA